jgi:hypothetical protein
VLIRPKKGRQKERKQARKKQRKSQNVVKEKRKTNNSSSNNKNKKKMYHLKEPYIIGEDQYKDYDNVKSICSKYHQEVK